MTVSQDHEPSIGSVTSGQSRLSIEALTAGQPEDVWERAGYWRANACVMAMQRDELLAALKALDEFILWRAESNASGNPEWECVSARINAARSAISKAEGTV